MDIYTILFFIGAAFILPIMIYIATTREPIGNHTLAAVVGFVFAAFTVFTIAREGVVQVVFNHNLNFWGTQVWYDLLISVSLALFFIVPRARNAGMTILPWIVFVASTASIGLLAMVARLWYLERRQLEAN